MAPAEFVFAFACALHGVVIGLNRPWLRASFFFEVCNRLQYWWSGLIGLPQKFWLVLGFLLHYQTNLTCLHFIPPVFACWSIYVHLGYGVWKIVLVLWLLVLIFIERVGSLIVFIKRFKFWFPISLDPLIWIQSCCLGSWLFIWRLLVLRSKLILCPGFDGVVICIQLLRIVLSILMLLFFILLILVHIDLKFSSDFA